MFKNRSTVKLLLNIGTVYYLSLFELFALFAALLLLIRTLGNDDILVAYQINTISIRAFAW